MIIKEVRVSLLRIPYVEQPALFARYDRDRELLAVEVETKSGLVGLGYQLYLREGFRTTGACLEEMIAPRVLGRGRVGDRGHLARYLVDHRRGRPGRRAGARALRPRRCTVGHRGGSGPDSRSTASGATTGARSRLRVGLLARARR